METKVTKLTTRGGGRGKAKGPKAKRPKSPGQLVGTVLRTTHITTPRSWWFVKPRTPRGLGGFLGLDCLGPTPCHLAMLSAARVLFLWSTRQSFAPNGKYAFAMPVSGVAIENRRWS